MRRPLRYMARELGLDHEQVAQLAVILDDLKTERAQLRVDHRRAIGEFAKALAADEFDEAGASKGASLRAESARRLEDAVVKALAATHAMLEPEQRQKLVYLLRSGQLTI